MLCQKGKSQAVACTSHARCCKKSRHRGVTLRLERCQIDSLLILLTSSWLPLIISHIPPDLSGLVPVVEEDAVKTRVTSQPSSTTHLFLLLQYILLHCLRRFILLRPYICSWLLGRTLERSLMHDLGILALPTVFTKSLSNSKILSPNSRL